jgi:hypothetical protein
MAHQFVFYWRLCVLATCPAITGYFFDLKFCIGYWLWHKVALLVIPVLQRGALGLSEVCNTSFWVEGRRIRADAMKHVLENTAVTYPS